jgi:hypothetical protein
MATKALTTILVLVIVVNALLIAIPPIPMARLAK